MKKLILAKGTEFEQNGKDLVLIDTDFRGGKPVMLNLADLNCGFINSNEDVKDGVTIDDLKLQDKTVLINDFNSETTFKCDEDYDAIGSLKVKVRNINLKNKDITINEFGTTKQFGVDEGFDGNNIITVNVRALNLEEKEVTINKETPIEVTTTSGKDGLSKVKIVPDINSIVSTYLGGSY